jgi:hypothetical protein
MQKYDWLKSDVFIHPASSTMMKSWEQIRKTITNIIGNMWGKQNPQKTQKRITFKNLRIYNKASQTRWPCQYCTSTYCVHTVNTKTICSNLNSLNTFTTETRSPNVKPVLIRHNFQNLDPMQPY